MPEDDHPWFGIPFPGAYVVDGTGVVIATFFEHSLAIRPSGAQLLRAALGERLGIEAVSAADPVPDVEVEVSLDSDAALAPGTEREVVARFRMPSGRHLYGEPVPDGLVAATIELDDDLGLISLDLVTPPTSPLTLPDGLELRVFEGDVVLRRAFARNGLVHAQRPDGSRVVEVAGTVRWQACDDEACGLPRARRFEFEVPAGSIVLPDIGPAARSKAPPMNGAEHFEHLRTRHA